MLIECPECGKQYSETANACPNCGYVEYEDEHIAEGIASIIIGILSWIFFLIIRNGILLIIPFLLFISSLLFEKKCTKGFSFFGFLLSSLGILFLIIRIIFF